jgi:hypothetical protein
VREAAIKDWDRDTKQGTLEGLSKVAFTDSMFELADLWTDDVEPESYVNFLDKLLRRITVEIPLENNQVPTHTTITTIPTLLPSPPPSPPTTFLSFDFPLCPCR